MKKYSWILFFFCILSVTACSTKKKTSKTRSSSNKQRTHTSRNKSSTKASTKTQTKSRPKAVSKAVSKKDRIAKANKYNYKNLPVMPSNLNIKYNIHKQAIRDTFNTIIDEFMLTKMKMEAMDLDVVMEKVKDANLEFSGRAVLITLPLKILVTKKTFIKDFQAEGEIELSFISNLDLDADWNLSSTTNLETYEWITKPNLDIGITKIPIHNLANIIIDKSKANLEKQIDETVRSQFLFKDRVQNTVKYIETPIKIDTIVDAWMQIIPQEINLDGVLNTEEWATGFIQVEGKAQLSSDHPKKHVPGSKLRDFAWKNELGELSKLSLFLDVTYKSINKGLREKFKGRRFSDGGKEVLIKEIKLSKYKDNLEVIVDVEGTFSGEILVRGIPKFDQETKTFYAEDIDLNIKANNIVQKAAAWMLKGKIKSKFEKMATFSITQHLEGLQDQLDTQVSKFNQKDKLEINLQYEDLTIDKFILDEDRVHTLVNLFMKIDVEVKDFQSFKNLSPSIFLKN